MVGQGRPLNLPCRCRLPQGTAWKLYTCVALISGWASCATTPAWAADATADALRIAWGGGGPDRQWQATLRVANGRFSQPQPLGIEADEPGSIWIDDDELRVRNIQSARLRRRRRDAVGDSEARLIVNLAPVERRRNR